jgi:3-deoxy-D-arabino-heptulosonate 7-phosphate (DAHP) synthase
MFLADIQPMKVIIQDIAAREFLAANGRWVTDKEQAQDFFTLLRAYHFAQANTTIHFRVLLHCPEDDYSASIIEGMGMAEEQSAFCVDDFGAPRGRLELQPVSEILAKRFDVRCLHLN